MTDKTNNNRSKLSSPFGGEGVFPTRGQGAAQAALPKLKHYCTYQERSHFEVIQKLWELKVPKSEHDIIIATLIDEDYLNEERFAIQYAGGKFRMKEWGKKKIQYGLREKKVSDYSIKKALAAINEKDYIKVLYKLAEEKYNLLKTDQYLERKKKTINFLIQKGYEYELINNALSSFTQK